MFSGWRNLWFFEKGRKMKSGKGIIWKSEFFVIVCLCHIHGCSAPVTVLYFRNRTANGCHWYCDCDGLWLDHSGGTILPAAEIREVEKISGNIKKLRDSAGSTVSLQYWRAFLLFKRKNFSIIRNQQVSVIEFPSFCGVFFFSVGNVLVLCMPQNEIGDI